MLSVIHYSFNAVMPIILLILMGVLARRTGYLDAATFQKINKFNFRFNFFALMFVNLYTVESIRQMPVRMGIFMLTVLSVLLVLGIFLSGAFTKERFRRGVLVQAVFRSNYAIVGIPVAVALVGEEGGQMASFLQFPIVMFFNFMSVLVLNIYSDYEAQYRLYGEGPLAEAAGSADAGNASSANAAGPADACEVPSANAAAAEQAGNKVQTEKSKIDLVKILKGVILNPLIQGLVAGFIVLILREVIPKGPNGELVFSIERDIPWLYSSLQSLSRLATPLALVVLGGQLEMKEISGYKKELIAGVFMRLVGSPAVGFALLYAAVIMGLLVVGPVEIAVMVAIFGSPMAVASIVMSQEMGGDGHLAGQIVVWTSVLGMVSLFLLIFTLRMNGLL